MEIEVLVVHMGQTSKPFGTLTIPAVDANNKPMPQKNVVFKRLRAGGRNGSATIFY